MTNGSQSLDVLIIEDDADARANLCDILELDGHRTSTAATGAEALAPRDWSAVEVMILDRKLPDASAEQLLPKLKRLAPQAHIIVATGLTDVQGAITALQHGAADYLLKPVQPDILRATLARLAERRRLERDRQRSQAALSAVIETSPCMIVVVRNDYRIVYFSPYAEELTGYAFADIVGKDYFSIFLPDDERPRLEAALLTLKAGTALTNFENDIRCRNGMRRKMIWNSKVLADYDGEPALLGVGLDITEHKRAVERALQAQRLAAIGETMTGLVHESRNALQRSRACLEMLSLEVQDRPEALDLVSRVQRAQDHLQHLYEEVRQYAAPLTLRRESTDMCDLWRDVWHDLAVARKGRSVSLVEDVAGEPPRCSVDRFAISQVLRNILENALQASPTDATITIRCRAANSNDACMVELSVIDAGPGLGAEQRQRIFEPFFTTKAKGTGLGMAIAQRIVEAHGGRIAAVDRPPPGAEIVVTLPRENT